MSWVTDHAEIEYTQDDDDVLRVLLDKDDTPLRFDYELQAHGYIRELADDQVV